MNTTNTELAVNYTSINYLLEHDCTPIDLAKSLDQVMVNYSRNSIEDIKQQEKTSDIDKNIYHLKRLRDALLNAAGVTIFD